MPKKQPEFKLSDEQCTILLANVHEFRIGDTAQRKLLVGELVEKLCPETASSATRACYTKVQN